MEEIRCPICGTENPGDAESCSYCGAPFTRPDSAEETDDGRLRLGDVTGQSSDESVDDWTAPRSGEADENGARLDSGLLIFEPDTGDDIFSGGGIEMESDVPAMWLPEEEWFGRQNEQDSGESLQQDKTGLSDFTTASSQQSEIDGEGLPEWLRQALESEGNQKKSGRIPEEDAPRAEKPENVAFDSDEVLNIVEDEDESQPVFDHAEGNADEGREIPSWLENMAVDDEMLARFDEQEEPSYLQDETEMVFKEDEDHIIHPQEMDEFSNVPSDVEETEGDFSSESSEVPEWLDKLTEHPAFGSQNEEQDKQPVEDEQLPQEEERIKSELPAEEETADGPAEGQVDDETALSEEELQPSGQRFDMLLQEEEVEESGPLAGLSGVLAGDEVVARYSTPPLYSGGLQASEKQKKEVMLLKQMLAKEARPQPASPIERPVSLRLGRMVTGILLILVILLPVILGVRQVPVPGLYPVETVAFNHYIDSLSDDQTVLLAMEYEPAFSGEMLPSARLVLEHLMEQKARIAMVSTVPAGPVIVHNLLLETQPEYPAYNLNSRTINLGYLPGGESGVKAFALQPQKTTRFGFDISHNGAYAWQHTALKGVDTVDDFSLVIVMAGDLENARPWIEQLQPSLDDTPLLVIASAQASPMLQPYYSSNQIQGLISGLSGAAAYEQLSGLPGLVTDYWAGYQYGLLAIIMLVLVGIPIQLFIMPNLKSERKKRA